jgi:DNA-binding winged helix-turn-helix (wHTH) protein/tetratricopeptide (TPR) repeat protein
MLTLTPKAFAVLQYLVAHASQLVTKEALLAAVWPEMAVSEAVLKVCLSEIRKALGDTVKTPRYIATVYRRGYRFIAPVTEAEPVAAQGAAGPLQRLRGAATLGAPPRLVGRESALLQLHGKLAKALQGKRQVVFVTGEIGIGKTALVEAFVAQITAERPMLVMQGQCVEHYGPGEAYLPVLEALGRLCGVARSEHLLALLYQRAPMWLAQLPWLLSPAERCVLQRELVGATQERMLREMAEAFEVLTADTPLVLVLEDLHWSDYATLDLLALLARRREPARLMVLGTYRPVDVMVRGHPLQSVQQELHIHGQCAEVSLVFLSLPEVAQYLAMRFPQHGFPDAFAQMIHWRTDGNPLFMVNVVESLVAQGLLEQCGARWERRGRLEDVAVELPESLRHIIEQQLERLGPEAQQVLEAASVVGVKFGAGAVAAGLEGEPTLIEERCDRLVQQQFLRQEEIQEWSDGTITACYSFRHALYQQVLYQRLAAARRLRLHQRVGEYLEKTCEAGAGDAAAPLALHFSQGRDYRRTVQYLRHAADNVIQRYANREAIGYLRRALELVDRLPPDEQPALRLAVLEQRAKVRNSMGDLRGAAEDFTTLAADAHRQGQVNEEVKAWLAAASALSWVDRARCRAALERAVALSSKVTDTLLRAHARAYWGHWYARFRGWREEDVEACTTVIAAARQAGELGLLSLHVARSCYFQYARSDYQAVCRTADEGLPLALDAGQHFDYLYCQYYRAQALLHLGQWGDMLHTLRDGLHMAERNGHHLARQLLQLAMVWLHEQAGDFASARALGEHVLAQAQATQHTTGYFFGLLLLGCAHHGLGQAEHAWHCFSAILQQLEHDPDVLEWIFQMPLRHALSEYWLAQAALEPARQEAQHLCELAAQPGERTYLALGKSMLAKIALAEQQWEQAESELSQALAVLEGAEAPLAAWRVYATAARLYAQRGRRTEARQYWSRSAAVCARLADSLGTAIELRQSLYAYVPVASSAE